MWPKSKKKKQTTESKTKQKITEGNGLTFCRSDLQIVGSAPGRVTVGGELVSGTGCCLM